MSDRVSTPPWESVLKDLWLAIDRNTTATTALDKAVTGLTSLLRGTNSHDGLVTEFRGAQKEVKDLMDWKGRMVGNFWKVMLTLVVTVALTVATTLWHNSHRVEVLQQEVAELKAQLKASPPLAPLQPPPRR